MNLNNNNDDEEDLVNYDTGEIFDHNVFLKNYQKNNHFNTLILDYNNISPEDAVLLCLGLENNNTIDYFNLDYNNLGNDGAKAIGTLLEHNNKITMLSIIENNIGPEGAVAIFRGLQSNNTISSLWFACNNIGPEGAVALGLNLQSNKTLKDIGIAACKIGFEGVVALGRALESNNTLDNLDLCHNEISNEGAVPIGKALEFNNTLEYLDLSVNNIGNDGAVAVIRSIARNTNTHLSTLDISENNITQLPAELAQCRTIRRFNYRGNPIEYIPPHVQRWLDRFQDQQNIQIHQDSQNVHNRQIQQCITDSMNRIINACHTPISFEEVRNLILNDSILTSECKNQLINYASDETVHSSLGLKFVEALQYVFTRIVDNENGPEIKRILNKEMLDALCMCFTGRISRLIDCMNGLDPLVVIDLSPKTRILSICQQTYELLNGSSFTAEDYQTRVKKELEDRGFELTEEIQTEFIDPILQDL